MSSRAWGFYEFFAGGGMARLGLGSRWRCTFANEICEKKAAAYRANFGPSPELRVEDVWRLKPSDLPQGGVLAWGSFPCQDLSLAGAGAGLAGSRSGTFVPFWRLVESARPPIAVLENVPGILSSHGGRDLRTLFSTITASGYRAGALVVDAARFVPQSRRRVFVVAVRGDVPVPPALIETGPDPNWHPSPLVRLAAAFADDGCRDAWIWWRLPVPEARTVSLADIAEREPDGVGWNPDDYTERLLGLMSPVHRERVRGAQDSGSLQVGTVYRRTRPDGNGGRVQRAEVRFDGLSGCLRTPAGGSSRQTVLVVNGEQVRSRLLSPREAARLMGLPDSYQLPQNYNDAYHVAGDGLAIPAVSWLERHLLAPLAQAASRHQTG